MGAPATLPEAVIAGLLDAVDGLTLGTNLFSGPELPGRETGIPNAAVFCQGYDGGGSAEPYLGTGIDLRHLHVQVVVRGEAEDVDTARALAWNCWQRCQRQTAPAAGYIDCLCLQSGPSYLAKNEVGQPRFSFNVQLRYEG